ncbi:MAG: hypothetical protein JRI29_00820, partial [Deltaproteobacteria bacterium]|nr:hypothetical protein [Deltaproteobacteria bacterium]
NFLRMSSFIESFFFVFSAGFLARGAVIFFALGAALAFAASLAFGVAFALAAAFAFAFFFVLAVDLSKLFFPIKNLFEIDYNYIYINSQIPYIRICKLCKHFFIDENQGQ